MYGIPSNGFSVKRLRARPFNRTDTQIARGVFCTRKRVAAHGVAAAVRANRKAYSLTSFQDLRLNDAITRALAEEKYLTPTPIQVQTIPIVMSGRDVIGIAQTGTGKTAAFALPILHHLVRVPGSRGARLAGCWCSARRANCPAKSLTASAPTAATCGCAPRWRSAAYRWPGKFGPCLTALTSSSQRRAGCSISSEQCASPRRRRMPRARRSRPDARHGLHPRRPQDRRRTAGPAADAAVLGHHAARRRRTRRADAARPGQGSP